jgi:hypothetical protein
MKVKDLVKILKKHDPDWNVTVTREEETGALDDYPVLRVDKIWDGNPKVIPEISLFISDLPKE